MLYNQEKPPRTTGRYTRDIPMIYSWCEKLVSALNRVLNNLDDANISSVSASKLKGGIDPVSNNIKGGSMEYDGETLVITGGTIKITGAVVRLENAGGTAYIEMTKSGSLNIKGANIT